MSVNIPPEPNVNTFNNLYWIQGDVPLTTAEGDLRYLKFPVAQGTENLQAINVNGIANFNDDVTVANSTLMTLNGQVSLNANMSVGGFGSISLTNADITMSDDSLIIQNGTRTLPNILGSSQIISGSNIQYLSDNTQQTSAFTGAGALAGSYTYTSMSVDANGQITALSSGIPPSPAPFAPIFANFANYQTGTTGYSQGNKITCGGTWGANDYVMFRITAQINWGISGTYNSWANLATTQGQLIFRPFWTPAGVWAGNTGSLANYTTNSGNPYFGSYQNALYYLGAINNGTQSFFYIYGSGGTGGGASGSYIQLQATAPGTTGGWQYTHLLEYICHSTTGGTITLVGGNGTNNSLP